VRGAAGELHEPFAQPRGHVQRAVRSGAQRGPEIAREAGLGERGAVLDHAGAAGDGLDLGAGVLHLFVARSDADRRTVLLAIGPVWNANEVWLLAAGGQLRSGAPEDLVLNGSLEAAFAEEDVAFDRGSGNFVINTPQDKPVRLTGEGPALFWTRRALQRTGYEPVDAPSHLQIHVEDRQGSPVWLLERAGETTVFDSIQKLLQAIAGK
jgi:hypothetical protein